MNLGRESETVEFKKSTSELKEGVISIASVLNKHGNGTLYFGVKDNGDVVGQDIGKDTQRDISRAISNHIKPDCYYEITVRKTPDEVEYIEVFFNGSDVPYSAYGRYYQRFADEDKIISRTQLGKFFQKRQEDYAGWGERYFQARPSSIDSLLLLGAWDEQNKRDRELVSALCGVEYAEAVQALNGELEAGVIVLKNSKWVVEDRLSVLERIGKRLTGASLKSLAKPLSEMLTSIDMQYTLPEDERIWADVKNVNRGCSDIMREAAAAFCACLSNNRHFVLNCLDNDIDLFLHDVIAPIFDKDDWKVLASSESVLPLLAEAAPSTYLALVKHNLQDNVAVKELFQNKTGGFISMGLGSALIRGIQIAAIDENVFSRAIDVLIDFFDITPYAKNALVETLLPWRPQTMASVKSRKGIGKKLAETPNEEAWEALLDLLPNRTNRILGVLNPQYLKVPDFTQNAKENITVQEIVDVGSAYASDAIKGMSDNVQRMVDLVDILDSFSSVGLVGDFCSHISPEIENLDDNERYNLWCALLKWTGHWRDHLDWPHSPPQEDLVLVEELASTVKPQNDYVDLLRVCSLEDYELIDLSDLKKERDVANEMRVNFMRSSYESSGFSIVHKLISLGAKPHLVGATLAQIQISKEDENNILEMHNGLDEESMNLASAYVWKKQQECGWAWVDSLSMVEWSPNRIASFFSSLDCDKDAWERAELVLGSDDSEYWKKAGRLYDFTDVASVEHYATKMLSVGRFETALEVAGHAASKGIKISTDIAFEMLENFNGDVADTMTSFYIENILKYLEETSPTDRLFRLEWRFARVISDRHRQDSYLFKRLAEDPDAFVEILLFANGKNLETTEKVPSETRLHANFYVLAKWCIVPGYKENRVFDEKVFEKWLDRVLQKANEVGCLESAERQLGRNFFHSKPDTDEFFIPKAIASFLESSDLACEGYRMESVNSREVHFVDETGEQEENIANSYEEKAKSAEAEGYVKFAAALHSIASHYRAEAERNRNSDW